VKLYRVVLDDGPVEKVISQLALPEKPSMVVLPFDNMSADVEQEYFADGLTEDIITELSRFQTFFVIARHSAFAYKGKPVKVQDVGRGLGVHYVVEGSVRRAGNRLRVVVQLIEAASGNHIWAERYDHDLADVFDLQDEVTRSIVAAIPGRLAGADLDRISRKRPESMVAYDYVLRGKMHHHRSTKEDNAEALRLLDKAIELDPEFAEAYAWKSCTYGQAIARGFGDNKKELFAQDVAAAEKALSLDENNIECQWIMCELNLIYDELEQAEFHHQKAFALNPNDPRIVAQRGELLTWQGHPVEGADWLRQAMRLDPYDAAGRAHLLGRALYVARYYVDAIEAFKQVSVLRYGHHAEIAACYSQLGSGEKAELHAGEVLRLKPDFSIADHVQGLPFKESRDREHHRDGLRKAGLPE
jgi:adenylate cyclase